MDDNRMMKTEKYYQTEKKSAQTLIKQHKKERKGNSVYKINLGYKDMKIKNHKNSKQIIICKLSTTISQFFRKC